MRTKISFSKQILSIFLCLALMLTYVPSTAFAATNTYDFSTNQSPLTINSSNKDQYDGATITGSYTLYLGSDILVIDGVTVNLTIEDLTLNTTGANTEGYSPIDLRNNATLNLTVKGTNTLSAEYHAAGIHVPAGCTLNITADSTGTLTVNGGGGYGGGAGIGADGNGYFDGYDSTTQTCGTINIAGGTIVATGGGHYVMGEYILGGAGIGGSTTGDNGGVANTGNITISGGNVTAIGGGRSAGIGGGEMGYVESISITGGTVTAAAEPGAAIGTGVDAAEAADIDCGSSMKISITGGAVTADGNIGYGKLIYGNAMTGGSVTIGTNASVALTDGHKIDHGDASDYAIIPVTLNVYDGRLTDTTEWVTMNATQSGNRVGGAGVELAVSNYHGTAKLNFVVPAANATGATDFTVAGNGFTATSESSATLTTSGIIVNCGKQLYPVTLTFLDDEKFTSEANDYTATLTVTTEGGTPAEGTIMATLPNTIEYHSASMGTMVVWLAAGTYDISVTQSALKADGAMTGNITVTGSTTLNLLNNSSVQILGNLDLSYGSIKFYKDGDAYKVDYYATADDSEATTATVLVSAPFVVTQSGETTTNTITVTDWSTAVPLNLTIDGLNVETSTALSKDDNAGHIDINGSAVNLNLSGSSSLKSTYETRKEVTAALVSVDGSSSLTIDGTGSLTVYTNAYGAAIGGDYNSDVGSITIKGGTVDATSKLSAAAIGTGYAAGSGGHAVITIEGGTVNATVGYNNYLGQGTAIGAAGSQSKNANTASVTITGGEVNATGVIGASNGSATVEITGGTVKATANTGKATIGGVASSSDDGTYLSVTISGGTVNAANTGDGPAIGGSGNSEHYSSGTPKNASVTINGGTVTAINNSATAATIGNSVGDKNFRTDVTINGGRVTVTNSAEGGVAIGASKGSYDTYAYTNVTISGGTVAATGVIGSAAQVAGYDSDQYATVKITGGSVNGEVWAYSDADTNQGATNGTSSVYMITATLPDANAAVTSASITSNTSYGFTDIYTDADSKIYLWLPYTGSETTATFGGADYTGEVKTDNTGVFTIDCDHSGNTNKPNDNGDGTHDATCSDCGAMVVDNEEHTLTCSASDNTITVSCSINCGYTGTATISATSKTYDGTAAEVIVTKTGDLESENIAITYAVKDGEALTEAPVNADTYTASITLGDKTVSVEFTIAPVTITADMITVNSTVYNGETQIPKETITVGGVTLVRNEDYTVQVWPDENYYRDAGEWEFFIHMDVNPNYTGESIRLTQIIEKATPTVAGPTAKTDLIYDGSEQALINTGSTTGGTLQYSLDNATWSAEIPVAIKAGTYTVYYKVVGDDNYNDVAAQSITVTIADKTEPTGEILIKDNGWKQFWNWITFGIFCKDNVDVTITADGTGSGIAKVEYLLSGTALDENNLPTDGWTELTANDGKYSFSITPQNKTAVYVRITDEYDNVTVINSDGIVVYEDSVAIDTEVTYTYNENSNKDVAVTFNGNTVKSIVCGETTLVAGTHYTVDYDNGKIVLSATYLNTLNASDTAYTFTVSYDPMGVKNSGVTDLTTTFTVHVKPTSIAGATVTVNDTFTYDNNAKTPDPVVVLNGETLIKDIHYTVSYTENVNAGTAIVTVTGKGNYSGTASGSFVIKRANLTDISVQQNGKLTYDGGNALTPAVTANATALNDAKVYFMYSADGTSYGSMPSFTEAGTYTVYYCTYTVDSNFYDVYDSFTVTIDKATVTEPTIASKPYNGTVQKADISNTDLYTVEENNGGTEKGSYDVVLKLKDSANYKWSTTDNAEVTLQFVISAAQNTWETKPSISGWSYGETAKTPVSAAKYGTVKVVYSGTANDGSDYNSETAPTKSGNYTATFTVEGTEDYSGLSEQVNFTIAKKAVTVTANDASKTYGDSDPALTYTHTELVGSDALIITVARVSGENANTYTITASQAEGANPNYEITFKNGTFTIDRATLTVTVEDKTATYGDAIPNYTVKYDGFKNGDDKDDLGGTLAFDCDYAQFLDKGEYTIKASGYTSGNYTINYVDGKLNVSAKPITVTIQNATSIYGDNIAELKATDNGIVNGDTNVYSLATTATSTSTVGKYAITGTALDSNYDVTFVNGEYEITKREITITVEAKNTIVNTALPTYTYKVEGLVGEDKFVTEPTLTCNADITVIGEYDITASGADAGSNYSIKYVPAKLTVLTDNAVDAAAEYTEELKDYDPATVTSEDKAELDEILDEINTILDDENITDSGKKALEEVKEQVENLIKEITDATEATDTENTEKVKDVTAENVTPEDKTDLRNAKADLEKALEENGGNYTEDEKKAIEDEIKKIDEALAVIANVEDAEGKINVLPETITKSDEDAIKAAQEAYNALTGYEKSLVSAESKKALDDAVAALAELNKPADTTSPNTGDNSNLWLWVALLFISGGAVITLTVVDRKRRMAGKR